MSEPGRRVKVLIVDDEEPIRFLCEDLLSSMDFLVLQAPDGETALKILKNEKDVDIVICDLRMPGIDGLETTRRIKAQNPGVDIIVLTGFGSIETAVESMKLGAVDFLQKPFNLDILISSVNKVVEKRRLRHAQEQDAAAEGMLEKKMQELEALKREFISITSHELLTPLTPISGYLETLRQGSLGELTKDQRDAIDLIYLEIEKLEMHVKNLLSIREMQDGCLNFDIVDGVDPAELISDALRLVAQSAAENDIALKVQAEELPAMSTDPQKLGDVLSALLSNAVKFNRKGGQVTVRAVQSGDSLCIEVVDDGIGIEKEELPHVFDKFYQVQKGDTRPYEGVGIGLTMARGVVEGLGGTISISSEPDKGTLVTVLLPNGG